MEIQTAVHVENTEQKEHCGNAVEPKFTLFYEELLFHLFVQQGVIKKYFHCKLHQLNKQHSAFAFTSPAGCLSLHYQQWGEKQHFLLRHLCYCLLHTESLGLQL